MIFLMVLTNFACTDPVRQEIDPKNFTITADTLCFYPYIFRGTMVLKKDYIVMIDPLNAGRIHLWDIPSGRMSFCSLDDSLKCFLPALLPLSFYQFDLSSYYTYALKNNKLNLSRRNLNFKRTDAYRAIQLDKNKYVIHGPLRVGLLGLYDDRSRKIDYFGHYPVKVDIPFERDARDKIVQNFQGNIACSDNHSEVVYGSNDFAYLSCYHFTGRKLKFQWERHLLPPPEVAVIDGSLEWDENAPQGGFSDVTIAGDYIFACYQQSTSTDSIPTVSYSIVTYDLLGNHIATYHTDCPLTAIMVDMPAKMIYGISWMEDPFIVRFSFEM